MDVEDAAAQTPADIDVSYGSVKAFFREQIGGFLPSRTAEYVAHVLGERLTGHGVLLADAQTAVTIPTTLRPTYIRPGKDMICEAEFRRRQGVNGSPICLRALDAEGPSTTLATSECVYGIPEIKRVEPQPWEQPGLSVDIAFNPERLKVEAARAAGDVILALSSIFPGYIRAGARRGGLGMHDYETIGATAYRFAGAALLPSERGKILLGIGESFTLARRRITNRCSERSIRERMRANSASLDAFLANLHDAA